MHSINFWAPYQRQYRFYSTWVEHQFTVWLLLINLWETKSALFSCFTEQIFKERGERLYFLWLFRKYLWLLMLYDQYHNLHLSLFTLGYIRRQYQCAVWECDLFSLILALMHGHCVIFDKLHYFPGLYLLIYKLGIIGEQNTGYDVGRIKWVNLGKIFSTVTSTG